MYLGNRGRQTDRQRQILVICRQEWQQTVARQIGQSWAQDTNISLTSRVRLVCHAPVNQQRISHHSATGQCPREKTPVITGDGQSIGDALSGIRRKASTVGTLPFHQLTKVSFTDWGHYRLAPKEHRVTLWPLQTRRDHYMDTASMIITVVKAG